MRRNLKSVLVVALIVLILAGVTFFAIHFTRITRAIADLENMQQVSERLRNAPWQGVHYLPETREWRFYAVTGAPRQIELGAPVDLVKVYFLDRHGKVTYTWAATRISLPARPPFLLTDGPLSEGQLVALSLMGNHVDVQGVNWDRCGTEFCREAQRFDTLTVLDDQGTGISNGLIRYGWLPPTWPLYGFLCWQVEPVNNEAGRPMSIQEMAR